jgi:hypothetical protein
MDTFPVKLAGVGFLLTIEENPTLAFLSQIADFFSDPGMGGNSNLKINQYDKSNVQRCWSFLSR